MGQADGPAGFPEDGQGWKEKQPCKNTQLEATFREAMVCGKARDVQATGGALYTRGCLIPSGLGPYKVPATLSEAQAAGSGHSCPPWTSAPSPTAA